MQDAWRTVGPPQMPPPTSQLSQEAVQTHLLILT